MAKRLFVICGIGTKLSHNVHKALEKKFSKFADFRSISSPSSATKDTYSQNQITTIISTICKAISSKRADLPPSITIIYAPDKSQNCLISRCFLFAHLVCCQYSDAHNLDALITDISPIVDRYVAPAPEEYSYLPTKNFLLSGDMSVYQVFLEYFQGTREENDVRKYFIAKNFNSENFPNFLSGKKKKKFYVDDRQLIFPPCKPGEEHGDLHEENIQSQGPDFYLTGLYRFGILKGAGFHFDVQYAQKRLGNVQFSCARKGEIHASNQTHANIYLNDTVRLPQ